MTTRQNIPYIEDKEQLPTGYDTQNNDPSTFSIPPCGIEDADIAVHSLFDTEIKFHPYQAMVGSQKEINVKKPFVIFATGERFAMAKRLKPFRDRNGFLLLPAISIRRTGIEQQHNDMFPGELTIKRRLDESDVEYQQLINRYAFKNIPNPPGTLRDTKGINTNAASFQQGMLLDDRDPGLNGNHVYEVIAIPFPQFYKATYEVVFWTTYTQHMNYMIETLFASQIVPGKGFYLKTEKGYWFSALVEPQMKAEDNFDDITEGERIVKYSFELTVRGFLLAPQGLGQRVPFKRYLSAVNISFETLEAPGTPLSLPAIEHYNETKQEPTNTNPFVLTDIEQDPITQEKATTEQKIVFSREYRDKAGQTRTKQVTQMSNNQKKGETVYTASDQQALEQFFADKTKGY